MISFTMTQYQKIHIDMPLRFYFKRIFANDLLQLSTIWAETSDNARSAARSLVLGGLSEKHHGLNNFWVADRTNLRPYRELCLTFDYHHLITWIDLQDIDVEALRILNMYYDRAKEVKSFPDSSM